MRGAFFYTIGIAFTSGIFIRSFFEWGWAEIILCVVMGVACVLAGRQKASGFLSPLFLTSIALLSFALGLARMHYAETVPSVLSQYVDQNVSLTARIVREPEVRETMLNLYVEQEVLGSTSKELVLVTVDRLSYGSEGISYGDIVRIEGTLARPEAFETNGGRVFDYAGYLKARGVSYTISRAKLEMIEQEEGTFFGYLFNSKKQFQEALENSIPEPYAGLGEGVLLGVKRALGQDLEDAFRRTGIIHIVVLSGYNIMIVVECIMFVLSFFFFPRTRMMIGIGAISLFSLLVGLSATVVRAALMAALLIIARTTGHTYAVLRALIFAGVGMLILNPYLLVHDPGFELSFLATLGLILLAPHIEVYLTRIPEMLGMRKIITATIATQIFVLPILLYQMGTLSLVSVVVNALVLPMVPPAMLLTLLTGICGLVLPILGYSVGFLAYLSLFYIIGVARLFDTLPFAAVTTPSFPFWIVMVVYVLYSGVLVHLYNQEKTTTLQEEVENFEDWTFEDEVSPETRSVSGESLPKSTPFPFR
ncbi:MAG: ComEC/Rec2 family competence protein [Minisyncoccia bacterium]